MNIDLALTSFSPEQLNRILAPKANPGLVDADIVPEPPAKPITQPGDIWLLDQHRLLCGDSTRLEDVRKVMNGEKARLVATDPPYLVDYTGDRPNDSGKDWTDVYHEVDITDADSFFRSVFSNVLQVLAPKAAIYCWHAHKRQALIASPRRSSVASSGTSDTSRA